jgi:hypothetical protein
VGLWPILLLKVFFVFYREAMTPSSLAGSAREDVCVSLCGSVANSNLEIFGGPECRLKTAVGIDLFVNVVYVSFDRMGADAKL